MEANRKDEFFTHIRTYLENLTDETNPEDVRLTCCICSGRFAEEKHQVLVPRKKSAASESNQGNTQSNSGRPFRCW